MKKEIGVAILGCGYWGRNYVRIFNELSDAKVVAVCDQQPERLNEISKRFPSVVVETSLDKVLQLPEIDAVVISTGATTHFGLASQCITHGKHVLIEKPLTTNPLEATRLIELAETHGVKLMVGHTFLYNPAVTAIKDHISRADMGEIYYLYSCRTNLGPVRHDVNVLWDLAPHDISIFNYLLDATPLWVSAVGVKALRSQREDVGFVSVGYSRNVVGHIHVSWADPNKVRELVVVGSNRRIVFDDLNMMEQIRIFEKGISPVLPELSGSGSFQYQTRDGDIISPHIDISEPLKNQCRHFVNCIIENQQPRTDGHAGRDVVRVMAAIDQSIERNGTPVYIGENEYDNVALIAPRISSHAA